MDIESLVDVEQGLVSRRIFIEPQIYEGELERIFARGWLFPGASRTSFHATTRSHALR